MVPGWASAGAVVLTAVSGVSTTRLGSELVSMIPND